MKSEAQKVDLDELIAALNSRKNQEIQEAMQKLNAVADIKRVEKFLPEILHAAEVGSIITKNNTIGILCKLTVARNTKTFPLLLKMLKTTTMNQLPMYTKLTLTAVPTKSANKLKSVLEKRLPNIEQTSKRTHIERVLHKL